MNQEVIETAEEEIKNTQPKTMLRKMQRRILTSLMMTAATKLKDTCFLEKKAMTNLAYPKTKTSLCQQTFMQSQLCFFPVVMYGCESWDIKKAECQRIDAFELWCWRRLLRVPQTAKTSNQSILKEINPKYSLERLILKL